MKIGVCTNGKGEGEGSHVSVYALVIEGKYDDELNWPFVGKVYIDILNQLQDRNHYYKALRLTPGQNINAGEVGVILNIFPILNSLVTGTITHSTSKTTLCISGYLLKYQTTSHGWSAQSDLMNKLVKGLSHYISIIIRSCHMSQTRMYFK